MRRAPVAPQVVAVDEGVPAAEAREVQQHRAAEAPRGRLRRRRAGRERREPRRRREARAEPRGSAHGPRRGAGERPPGHPGAVLLFVEAEVLPEEPLLTMRRDNACHAALLAWAAESSSTEVSCCCAA